MTITYKISGMTCGNCKATVEKSLKTIPKLERVSVNLESNKVTIKSENEIELSELQSVLPEKYNISKQEKRNVFDNSNNDQTSNESDLKKLFPLFLILGYILIASLLLNKDSWNSTSFMLDFMGLFYVVFSFFKLLDLRGFPESFKMYDPLAKAIPFYAWIYPIIEVALGLMFLMRFQTSVALIATIIVLGITTIGVAKVLLSKTSIQCACLGTALKLPMTKATFIENSIMICMAIIMLIKSYGI